jgi:hypothetical protein
MGTVYILLFLFLLATQDVLLDFFILQGFLGSLRCGHGVISHSQVGKEIQNLLSCSAERIEEEEQHHSSDDGHDDRSEEAVGADI